MKKLAIFIVALAFLNFGGGGGVSSQSNFDSMIQTVRDYYELNVAAGRTGNNWLRVLIAFGAETHDSLTPFTAAEAWERVPRWGGWRPVAEALDQLEAQSAPALPTNTPAPTSAPLPTNTPLPTSTLIPTSAPLPTNTLAPTSTPWPTNTPAPTSTPLPTSTPRATPTIQSVQFEPPQAAPLQAEPAQAEPAQAPPAPTSWEAWVTKEPGDDYNANFSYKVPEGKMVKFKTTLHVQLTPANASVNDVVVYLHAPAAIDLNNHALEISDVNNALTSVPKSATAWTDQGGGHYTRPLYVTFQTDDDNIVKGGFSLGAIEIHTIHRDQQIRKGAGSRGDFFHVDDDLTFPKLGGLSYTSNTTGSYAVVSGRVATGTMRVNVEPVGDVSVKGFFGDLVEILGNTPYDTEVRTQKNGMELTFTCTGTGTGLGELVLTPHSEPIYSYQMLAGYSHRMQVCPNPAAVKAARQKVSNFSTATFRMRLTCAEWRNMDGAASAIAIGWENLRVVPAITVSGYYGNIPAEPAYLPRVCNIDFLHVWDLLGPQTTQVKCTVGEKMVKALDDGNVSVEELADRIRRDIRPDYEYRCFE